MKIGVIGAGFIGRAVAKLGKAAGHEVMLSNARGPQTLASVPSMLGCQIGTVEEAAAFGDVVAVAIPLGKYKTLPAAPLAGKVVLDANNYYPDRDGQIAALDAREATTSGLLAAHLPESRVVKCFNAIMATDLEDDGRPAGTPGRRALPIAGDDAASKAIAIDLVEQFGFDGVDAGPLATSWRFERAKPAYLIPFDRAGLIRALGEADRDVELTEAETWDRIKAQRTS